jgi:hypothetical protein
MALKPNTAAANATADNMFEEMEMTNTTQTTEAPAAEVSTSTAVAPAAAPTAVARPAAKFVPALTEFQNAIPLETIEGMGIGGLPRITADLGGFNMGDKPLGNQIKIQLLSWNVKYALVTGSTDAEANEFYKVSYDGIRTTSGESVDEYLTWLKNVKGYEKAVNKQYVDLWAFLTFANGKDLSEDECKTVNVQISPFSVSKWHAFQLDLGIRQARGMAVSDVIVLNAERGKMGANSFGYIVFSTK